MKTPENGDLLRILSVTECVTQGFWMLQGEKARFSRYARIVQQAVARGRCHQNVHFLLTMIEKCVIMVKRIVRVKKSKSGGTRYVRNNCKYKTNQAAV